MQYMHVMKVILNRLIPYHSCWFYKAHQSMLYKTNKPQNGEPNRPVKDRAGRNIKSVLLYRKIVSDFVKIVFFDSV